VQILESDAILVILKFGNNLISTHMVILRTKIIENKDIIKGWSADFFMMY
jgi:hypothetical protein